MAHRFLLHRAAGKCSDTSRLSRLQKQSCWLRCVILSNRKHRKRYRRDKNFLPAVSRKASGDGCEVILRISSAEKFRIRCRRHQSFIEINKEEKMQSVRIATSPCCEPTARQKYSSFFFYKALTPPELCFYMQKFFEIL